MIYDQQFAWDSEMLIVDPLHVDCRFPSPPLWINKGASRADQQKC